MGKWVCEWGLAGAERDQPIHQLTCEKPAPAMVYTAVRFEDQGLVLVEGALLGAGGGFGFCDVVDDLLDENDADVDAPGQVRQEFGDEVVGGG